jgi:hypothetical protein
MTRTTSAAAAAAMMAQETDEGFVVLLTLEHEALSEPVRVAQWDVDVVSAGETYIAFPFRLELPDDTEEATPRARLELDNVDRRIVEAVRLMSSPARVTIRVVLWSDPDSVEVEQSGFVLRNVDYDALTVRGDLYLEHYEDEPYPAGIFSPGGFPGLF